MDYNTFETIVFVTSIVFVIIIVWVTSYDIYIVYKF